MSQVRLSAEGRAVSLEGVAVVLGWDSVQFSRSVVSDSL